MPSKKELIQKRRQQLLERYGANPKVYGSGVKSAEIPLNLKIMLDPQILASCFPRRS